MRVSLVGLVLGSLLPDALKVLAGLVLAVLLALAFAISSLAALFGSPSETVVVARQTTPGAPTSDNADVVALAYRQIGMPYVWGGASPQTSFDCSGLVQWVYHQVGVTLPRTAQMQYNATERVPLTDLHEGDLVFFEHTYPGERITHVGIYVGNGRMINAPTTGDVVREMPIFSDPYWNAHYAGAGRVRR